jgi:hypothetical protein
VADDPGTSARWEPLAVALVVAAVYWQCNMSGALLAGAFRDDGAYLALGKAIASGEGYRSIYLAGAPVHLKYPPGLPTLLAALWSIGHTLATVRALALGLDILAIAIAAGMLWQLGRTRLRLDPLPLAVLAIGPLFLDATIQYGTLAIAEPFYLLGWSASLLLVERLRNGGRSTRRVPLAVALGVVLAATTLFRTEGIVLLGAIGLTLVADRAPKRVTGSCFAAAVLPLVGWWLFHRHLAAAGPHTTQPDEIPYSAFLLLGAHDPLGAIMTTIDQNVQAYLRMFAAYLSSVHAAGVAGIIVLLALGVTGSLREARRHPALVTSVAATGVMILLWPFAQDRFVLTILPFAGLCMASALERMTQRGGRYARYVTALLLGAGALIVLVRQVEIRRTALDAVARERPARVYTPSFYLPANSRSIALVSQWVRANTTPGDRLLLSNHTGVYLYTGRQGVPAAPAENGGARSVFAVPGAYLAQRIVEDSVTVIVLDNQFAPIAADVTELQKRCPASLHYLGSAGARPVPSFYRVRPDDPCIGAVNSRRPVNGPASSSTSR